jgi:hypothetical protein
MEAAKGDKKYLLAPAQLKVNVPAGGHYRDFRVATAGTQIKWFFNTAYYDITYTIKKFKNGGPLEGEKIHHVERASHEEEGHCGVLDMEDCDCTYEFLFDNSFSYLRSKDIVFSFDRA